MLAVSGGFRYEFVSVFLSSQLDVVAPLLLSLLPGGIDTVLFS